MLPYTPGSVADALCAHLDAAAAARGRATLAIPGGRSPGPALVALAGMCTPFLRQRLHLLWLDERAVPPGHPDRNDAATLAAWRSGGTAPDHVHPMPAEEVDLEAAALTYAGVVQSATAGAPLDACLIGIGDDGHFASLFPRHPGLTELSPVFAVYDSPKPPPRRLSLSLGVISQARLRVVLVFGAEKGRRFREAMRGGDPANPVSLLPRDGTVWYLDDAAVAAASP